MGGNAICWIDRHGPIRDDASVVCMVPVDSLLSESRLDEAVLASFDFSRFVPSLLGGNNRLYSSSSFLARQAMARFVMMPRWFAWCRLTRSSPSRG